MSQVQNSFQARAIIKFIFLDLSELIRVRIQRLSDGMFCCVVCGFLSGEKRSLMYHVEAKHIETPGYHCPICSKHCPSLNALKCHKRRCLRK